jgi:hypothetical protein
MARHKMAKARGAHEPAPLSPEAGARLESEVARVVEALSTETDPAALQALVSPDPQDPDWDAHLIAALGALSHPAIPPLLAALFGAARDKIRRKALKKTLHRLKTRGVAMAPDLLPKEEASFGAPRPGAAAVFVSAIFGVGETYVILEAPAEILGGNFLVARVSDQEGFKECVLLSLKRQQQAEVWGRFREQGLDQWFSPPPAYAVRLLEEAYAHKAGAASGAAQYGALREKIFRHWGRPEAAPDLEQELPSPSPGEMPGLLEHCRDLALDPLLISFLPGPEEIAPWLAKLQEVEASPLVLSEQQKQVRIDGVLDEATRSLYPPETRPGWSRRLLTTAYYLHISGREEDARALRAAAASLGGPESSALAGENAFLKSLVQSTVRLALEMQPPQEPATPSGLIASPGEMGLIRR